MKKIIPIGLIALIVSGIYSCSKKDDLASPRTSQMNQDLTANIVGDYSGNLQDIGYSCAFLWLNPPPDGALLNAAVPAVGNVWVQVTKIDSQDIKIETYVQTGSGVDSESYTAGVSAISGGDSLTIPQQSYGGCLSLAGGELNGPNNSGSFTTATGMLVTHIRVANGCYINFETFQGVKQPG